MAQIEQTNSLYIWIYFAIEPTDKKRVYTYAHCFKLSASNSSGSSSS